VLAGALAAVVVVVVAVLLPRRSRRRSRPARLAVHGPGAWWASPETVERYLCAAVLRGSSATGARARLRAAGLRWRVRLDADGSPDLRSEVERLARRALARLGAPTGTSLRVRVRPRRRAPAPDLELRPWAGAADGLTGRTVVRRSAVVAAVERDLRHLPGVRDAGATMDGGLDRPDLRLTVELAARADPARTRTGVRLALGRFEATTGMTPRAVDVTLRVAPPGQGASQPHNNR
jgi:hypothetical protein